MPWWMRTFPMLLRAPDDGGAGGGGDAGGASLVTGGGGSPAPAPASDPAGAGAGDAAPTTWDAALDPTQRQMVQTKGWKAPADVLRDYAQLESTLGRDKVALPGKDAKPEDWDAVWNKLGRPEKPDGYDLSGFQPPEGVPWNGEAQTAMVGEMHKLGLTQSQVAGVMQAYAGVIGQDFQAIQERATKAVEETQATLRKDWGGAYDANLELANRAVKTAFGDQLQEASQMRLADGTYLLDHPAIAKAFAKIGAGMSEDGDLTGARGGAGGAGTPRTPAEAKAEIEKIRGEAVGDPNHPYTNRRHPEFKAMQQRMNELYALANAGQAAVRD